MRRLGTIALGLALLLPLAACGGSSDSGGAPPAAASGSTSQAPAAGQGQAQGQTFTKSAPDQGFCDIFTEQDTAGLKMVTKSRPKAGQNQVSADQPVHYFCTWLFGSWGYNDTVGITVYPSADRAKQSMSLKIHGVTATDVVAGADESDYRAGTGDEVKAIVNARFGKFIFGVSLNDTVAKLSPDDAKKAAVGIATIMAQRCPNLR